MKKFLLPLLMISQLSFADLVLDNSVSQLNFGSIKNGSVAELHRFTTLTGKVGKEGKALIEVALDSVDTRIDIRDQRMKEHLFDVGQFPKAVFSADIDIDNIQKMVVGEVQQRRLKGKLDFHGKQAELDVLVRVVKTTGGAFTVYTVEPTFIRAEDFDLGAGIDKLVELAGLKAIAQAVPVTFSVVFREGKAGDKPEDKPEEKSPLKKLLPF